MIMNELHNNTSQCTLLNMNESISKDWKQNWSEQNPLNAWIAMFTHLVLILIYKDMSLCRASEANNKKNKNELLNA